jgi:hypothetical protein
MGLITYIMALAAAKATPILGHSSGSTTNNTVPSTPSLPIENDTAQIVDYVIGQAKNLVLLLVEDNAEKLPKWLLNYLRKSIDRNPKKGTEYKVPTFYVLYKLHKLSISRIAELCTNPLLDLPTRPVTANFCWCTQFLAVFVAKTLQPLVKRLPEFTKDSNAINRILSTTVVPAGTLLISFDVERLYPLIPLTACLDLTRWHMRRANLPRYLVDITIACLDLVLHYNFCSFNWQNFHQIVGFATGEHVGLRLQTCTFTSSCARALNAPPNTYFYTDASLMVSYFGKALGLRPSSSYTISTQIFDIRNRDIVGRGDEGPGAC